MAVHNRTIETGFGEITLSETDGVGLPVLLIHGNSSCKEVFKHQIESDLGRRFHLIAMDLPGHGFSSDAIDPSHAYSLPGYAAAACAVLHHLELDRAAVFGWSLGGHVGIEMLPLFPGMAGLMIAGAPPVRKDVESIMAGFQPSPALMLAGKEAFSEEDFRAFADLTIGEINDPALAKAMRRAHGLARSTMFQSLMAGEASDERDLVENAQIPIAIVNGEMDKLVNLDYVGGLRLPSLWDGHQYILRGLGHISFREAPDIFNPIFGRFLADVEKAKVSRQHGRQHGRRLKTRVA